MSVSTTEFDFEVTPQPTETTCGPAALHAVYRYYDDHPALERVLSEVPILPTGGTMTVFLGLHARQRGYRTTIYTCDLQVFDPSWFSPGGPGIEEGLIQQARVKQNLKLQVATDAYLKFLELGGCIEMVDITDDLLLSYFERQVPIIAGLSSTWLYRCPRERQTDMKSDHAAGEPTGHFVVLHGLDRHTRQVSVADPWIHHPHRDSHSYRVHVDRVISAIMLGIVTFDAKLLILQPPGR